MLIQLLFGPFGPYVQLGEPEGDKKPKRVSVPKNVPPESVDLAIALKLLALPRDLGAHPEAGKKVVAAIGRFGPYVSHDGQFKSIPKDESVFDIGLERAVALLKEPKQFSARGALKVLGKHPGGQPAGGALFGPLWRVREARQGERDAARPERHQHDHPRRSARTDRRQVGEEGQRQARESGAEGQAARSKRAA